MQMPCKKCPYYEKKKEELSGGSNVSLIVGFCRLRERFITDTTLNKELCKDRATVLIETKNKETV